MATSPLTGLTDMSLRVTVLVEGSAIKDDYGIVSVNVTHEVNRISFAEIVLRGEVDVSEGTIPISDADDFKPGKAIAVTAGYGDSGETNIFKGVIVKHGVDIDAQMGFTVRLTCKHKAIAMTFNETAASFLKKTDSAIIQTVFGDYGVDVTVDATSTEHDFVFQHMSTDWDFALARAEFNGYVVTLDGDSAKVGKPDVSGTPALLLTMGQSIISFSVELNSENQPASVEAHAWDAKTQALLTGTATEPSVNAQGNLTAKDMSSGLSQKALKLVSPTPMDATELKAWAEGILLRKRLNAFRGTVKFIGSALAKTGTLITLEGVGQKFNGDAYISVVRHSIETGEWSTTVRIGLDNTPISRQQGFSYSPAGGQLPAIHGLQIGVVKKLSADPGSENRIQVTLQSNAATSADVWARFANFYASNAAGSGFLPEVGDEVVVGFFDADPRYPVIIGSMYSSKNVSPNPPADEKNSIKSITTKSKIKISMDDDKKIVVIETPGGNKITLSDDAKSIILADENSNKITMSSSGIELNSAKDIILKAGAGIKLDATAKLEAKSAADVALTGLNITATANVGFTAKGNATAEISASGQTTVKGAMVMIN